MTVPISTMLFTQRPRLTAPHQYAVIKTLNMINCRCAAVEQAASQQNASTVSLKVANPDMFAASPFSGIATWTFEL
jgi:hypothetical protein